MKNLAVVTLLLFTNCMFSQQVDEFTGSYSHNFPLLHVPSNRGQGVTLEAIYNSGIRVNQPAGEIGLGWELNGAGEISRSVNGYPDDVFNSISRSPKDVGNMIIATGQGALYPNNARGSDNYDLTSTRQGMDTADFTVPAYDNFGVRGPSLSGSMKLSYLDFYKYTNYHFGETNNTPDS